MTMQKRERLSNGFLKIGEVARDAGVLVSTVRYYTDIGLLKVADRTPGRYRLYDRAETLGRLATIKKMNGNRPTLAQIRQQLDAERQ